MGAGAAASGGRAGAAMAAEAGPELAARVAFRAAIWARGARLPGRAGGGAHQGPAAGRGTARLVADAEEKATRAARTRQPDSARGAASARGRQGRLEGARGGAGRGQAPLSTTRPLPGPRPWPRPRPRPSWPRGAPARIQPPASCVRFIFRL